MSDERPDKLPDSATEDSGSQALSEALRSSFVIVKFVMLVLVVLLLGSGIFMVPGQQRAIVLHFGKPRGEGREALLAPGRLYFAFPPPIDEHIFIPYSEIQSVKSTVGWYNTTPEKERLNQEDPPGPTLVPGADGYVITGDGNIIHTRATLHYRVDNPLVYEFDFVNASNAIVNALDNSLVFAAARFPVDGILYKDVAGFKQAVLSRVSELVRKQNLGIVIELLDIQSIPPRQLRAKFAEVTVAESARTTQMNAAYAYGNYATNQARATASAMKSAAQAESIKFQSAVQAEAQRFSDLLPRYQSDPALFVNYFLNEKLAQNWTNAETFFLSERSTGEKRELRIQLNKPMVAPTNAAPPPAQNKIGD